MAASLTAPPTAATRASILLVDDKPEKLLSLRAVLSELDGEIVEASSGRAALRELLNHEFSVILLDVNMPGMDGFETASLIRQRKLSEHTPIIFITAFSDDTHVARGYSLGAVDYIVAPVVPEVLRSKVAVFVDLFRKSAQIRAQADSLRKRADQLQRLTRASLSINAALSIDAMLRVVAESARDLLGAQEAAASALADDGGLATRTLEAGPAGVRELSLATFEDRYAAPAPGSRGLRTLSVPLTRRDGAPLGSLRVRPPAEEPLDTGDEALLVSLAQMASIAIENGLAADLREANRLKDDFLTTLSHELRTPLSAVLGWTSLLRSAPPDPKRLGHALEVIERNTLSQARMVDDLLDISRIAHGKLRVSRKPVELLEVLGTAVEAMRPAALAKAIDLRLEAPPLAPAESTISGDPERLQQVFRNLLSNAVKFTPKGGRVDVTVERQEESLVVRVRDDGAGISPAFLGLVFERFRQADASASRTHGGLGIGLAIVRHIVDVHGGRVTAESDGPGLGATFTVSLPTERPRIPARAVAAPPPLPDLSGVRVLLVDDDLDGREAIRELLAAQGAQVTAAASLAEALQRLEAAHDVLVTDIGMPAGDGYELLVRVRERTREAGGGVPAVALTAYARPEDRRRAIDAGFSAHVPKPVDPFALLSTILAVAARSGAEDGGTFASLA